MLTVSYAIILHLRYGDLARFSYDSACVIWKETDGAIQCDSNLTCKLDIYKDEDGDASFQLKLDSLPHAHAQRHTISIKIQESRKLKN
ncbi:hypothetical protein Tco_1244661 [Tanacetum coccineum]